MPTPHSPLIADRRIADTKSTDLGSRLSGTVPVLLGAILVFAPLLRSGQMPMAGVVLELLSVGLLAVLAWDPKRLRIGPAETWALILLFLYPLIYLVPIPAGLAQWLPGRELYHAAESLRDASGGLGAGRLSIVPFDTEAAWLLLLVPIAVYLGTRALDSRHALQLVLVLLGVAAFQATLGLMQYGAGSGPLYLGMEHAHGAAVGTYTNRNHLAGLLEMVLPITLALLLFSVGRRDPSQRAHWRGRINFLGSLRGQAAIGYGAIALLLLVAVVFTRSRAGIALTMLGILLATLAFARRIGGNNVYGLTGTLVAAAVGLGLVIGLAPVLDRFSLTGAIEDARWTVYSATSTGIGNFFPFGSGPGNYPAVFPAYQPLELGRWFINHAHNDYLEWLFEGGVFAALLVLLLAGLYLRQWGRIWSPGGWTRMRFVQVGAGIGLLLLLLHSLVDFNLHIPANIVYFAFLAGIFFADPEPVQDLSRSRRRHHRTPKFEEAQTAPPLAATGIPPRPPADQIKNPFLD